jgi:maltose/moltooligosaccharide transporter
MPTPSPITGTRRSVRDVSLPRLGAFWLGVQAVWGALLGISLQSRTMQLAPGNALVAYGYLAAAGALAAAVVQVAVGPWSDARRRHGGRRLGFYVAGAIGAAIAIAAFYGARSFAALAGSFLVLQVAMNVAIGPYQAVIPDFVEPVRFGKASSWMAALQSAGNAIGAICASAIDDLRLLAALLAALLLGTCAVTAAQVRSASPLPVAPHGRLVVGRSFADLFVSRVFVYAGFYTLLGYLLLYVSRVLGVASPSGARLESGILILAFTAIGVAGAAAASAPTDRLDKRLVATVGGVAFCAALLVFVLLPSPAAAAAATAIAGLGWGVFLVADWAIACRLLPAGAMATTMGVWNLAVLLPQIGAPVLTTLVLQRLSATAGPAGPRIAFLLAAGETLLGIAWLWRLSRCGPRE